MYIDKPDDLDKILIVVTNEDIDNLVRVLNNYAFSDHGGFNDLNISIPLDRIYQYSFRIDVLDRSPTPERILKFIGYYGHTLVIRHYKDGLVKPEDIKEDMIKAFEKYKDDVLINNNLIIRIGDKMIGKLPEDDNIVYIERDMLSYCFLDMIRYKYETKARYKLSAKYDIWLQCTFAITDAKRDRVSYSVDIVNDRTLNKNLFYYNEAITGSIDGFIDNMLNAAEKLKDEDIFLRKTNDYNISTAEYKVQFKINHNKGD